MKLKDFITVIVFGIIGFVVGIIGGYAAVLFGPLMYYVGSTTGTLVLAPVFVTMAKKVGKKGSVILFYLVMGVPYIIMGMWPMMIVTLLAGIVGELFLLKDGYGSNKDLGISYVASQLVYAMHGLIFILYFGTKGLSEQFPEMFNYDRAKTIADFYFNPLNLSIVLILQIAVGILAFMLAVKIYNKFFSKSRKKDRSKLGK